MAQAPRADAADNAAALMFRFIFRSSHRLYAGLDRPLSSLCGARAAATLIWIKRKHRRD
ncbi:MAG: hypothetical protein ACJASC_003400 [Limimaricola cinnabarinus]|jgi:hypothetical protein